MKAITHEEEFFVNHGVSKSHYMRVKHCTFSTTLSTSRPQKIIFWIFG